MAKKKNKAETTEPSHALAVFIDRIEDNLAVLALCDDDTVSFRLPLRYLPDGAAEGDHLRVSFEADAESASFTRSRVAQLQQELTHDDAEQTTIKL